MNFIYAQIFLNLPIFSFEECPWNLWWPQPKSSPSSEITCENPSPADISFTLKLIGDLVNVSTLLKWPKLRDPYLLWPVPYNYPYPLNIIECQLPAAMLTILVGTANNLGTKMFSGVDNPNLEYLVDPQPQTLPY